MDCRKFVLLQSFQPNLHSKKYQYLELIRPLDFGMKLDEIETRLEIITYCHYLPHRRLGHVFGESLLNLEILDLNQEYGQSAFNGRFLRDFTQIQFHPPYVLYKPPRFEQIASSQQSTIKTTMNTITFLLVLQATVQAAPRLGYPGQLSRIQDFLSTDGNDITAQHSDLVFKNLRREVRGIRCAMVLANKCIPPCRRYHGRTPRKCNHSEKAKHIMYYLKK